MRREDKIEKEWEAARAPRVRQLTKAQIWANILFALAVTAILVGIEGWPRIKFWLLLVTVLAFGFFTEFNWRCPYCHMRLGSPTILPVLPTACSRCNRQLSDPPRFR